MFRQSTVDSTHSGGLQEGVRGRQTERKSLIVVAAQEDGPGNLRIRMKRIPDAPRIACVDFVEAVVDFAYPIPPRISEGSIVGVWSLAFRKSRAIY
jgi:hypothetical protein